MNTSQKKLKDIVWKIFQIEKRKLFLYTKKLLLKFTTKNHVISWAVIFSENGTNCDHCNNSQKKPKRQPKINSLSCFIRSFYYF